MDCCNYMQYHHHGSGGRQPHHYAAPFYDGYGRDFYNHPYQNYYSAPSHYYPQQWPCATAAAPFSDYVYNPKEARIRKAMREASRERIGTGVTPIPPPRGARRLQHWSSTHEDQLMMTPSGDINSSMYGNSMFSGVSATQFHHHSNYAKFVHVLPHNGWMNDFPSYLQHNPIAELQQHQANMWHQYQEPIRPCSSGSSYNMMDSGMSMYHEGVKKQEVFQNYETSHPSNISTPPRITEKIPKQEQIFDENQENHPTSYYPPFEETATFAGGFERNEETKPKKLEPNRSPKSVKALPDFNEAFGSTERGRFQSPPDPRLTTPNKDPFDYFFLNDEIRFDEYQT